MKRNNLITSLVSILVVVAAVIGFLVAGARPQLGLDLQGGISAIYTPVLDEGEAPDNLAEILDETIAIVRSRVDSLGVAEPDISRQGTDVLVQLPGLQDADRAQEVIGTTAKLAFRPVVGLLVPGSPGYDETPSCIIEDPASPGSYVLNPDRPAPPETQQGVVCGPLTVAQTPVETPTDTESDTPTDTEFPTDTTSPTDAASPADTASPTETSSTTPSGSDSPSEDVQSLGDADVVVVAAQDATETVTEAPSPTDSATASERPSETANPTDAPTPSGTETDPFADLSEEELADLLGQSQQGGDPYAECPSYFAEGADPTVTPEGDAPAVTPVTLPAGAPQPLKYQVCAAPLTGDNIDDARPNLSNQWGVGLDLDGPGGDAFGVVTAQLACDRDAGGLGQFAIVLDDVVESAPGVNDSVPCGEGITGGSATITVGGSSLDEQEAEAQDLALVLRTGALPLTLVPSTFQTVSPSLGSQSLQNGLLAGLIGLFLVAIYLIYFYRLLGLISIAALSIFGIMMYGIVTLLGELGFALTLAGIAGIIVSIGITADSSIIFFERIRDEVGLGKTMRSAVSKSFDSAFRTNLAGNTVTASAALILYFLAVGPVRGFALTLGLATLLDIVILYFFTRPVVGLLAGNKTLTAKSVRGATAAPLRSGGAS